MLGSTSNSCILRLDSQSQNILSSRFHLYYHDILMNSSLKRCPKFAKVRSASEVTSLLGPVFRKQVLRQLFPGEI